jgi:hypothetical protein
LAALTVSSIQQPRPFEEIDISLPVLRQFAAAEVLIAENDRSPLDWRCPPEVAGWIDETIDAPPYLPCGHSGIRNLRDGGFTCCRDSCDREFPRDVAREVLEQEDTCP